MYMPYEHVLCDLDGTLFEGDHETPGAIYALNKLRKYNLTITFVTNTTTESRRSLYEKLIKMGFELSIDEIFTSLICTRELIKKKGWKKPMFFLEPAAMEDMEGIQPVPEGETADVVIVGLAPAMFNYETLNLAYQHLQNGAELVAIHEGRFVKEPGGNSLGPGGFVRALEYAAETKAILVGKPEKSFFLAALGDHRIETSCMIGDDVIEDTMGAENAGIKALMLKSGRYREEDEFKMKDGPQAYMLNFAFAVDMICRILKIHRPDYLQILRIPDDFEERLKNERPDIPIDFD